MKKDQLTNKTGTIHLKKRKEIVFADKELDGKEVKYLQMHDPDMPEKETAYIYKYMDLESALFSLRNKNVRFVEPTIWQDKYEGRFYNANFSKIPHKPDDTPFLLAHCMSMEPHDEAAWKIYSYGKVGLAAHCVQFKINRSQFRMELLKSKTITSGSSIVEGVVIYASESVIDNLHKKSYRTSSGTQVINQNHSVFFTKFDLDKYLTLLLLKRDYFNHRHEIRFFLIPPNANQQKGKASLKNGAIVYGKTEYIDIDWANIIEEIRIDSKCTDLEYNIFKDECLKLLKTSNRYQNDKKKRSNLEKKFTPIKTDVYGKRRSVTIEC